MNKDHVKSVLKQYADDNVPPDADLWPRIKSRLPHARPNDQRDRYHSSNFSGGLRILGATGALTLLALFVLTYLGGSVNNTFSSVGRAIHNPGGGSYPAPPAGRAQVQSNQASPAESPLQQSDPQVLYGTQEQNIGLSGQPEGTVVAVPTPVVAEPTQAVAQETQVPSQPTAVEPTVAVNVPETAANPFVDTSQDPLSTFALDVDTGSYTAARNYIQAGTLPPYNTVRVEEFVNYFRYDYPSPEESAFGISVDGAPSPFSSSLQPGSGSTTQIVRVGIQGRRISDAQRKDAVLTFVIDVSGSMAEPNRLPLVKQGLNLLVNELRPTDKIGIVIYGDTASVVLEHTSVSERDKILAAIDSLVNDGSTNAEEGLRLGYELASKALTPGAINRVILCSDGVANVGATSPEGIRQKIRDYTAQGIFLTTVGFGMGDYNDYLMEQLADDGDGNYAYVDSLQEARRIFVENLTGTLQVIAKDAKVQVEFNPAVVRRYRLIGYENRDVADADFRNDAVDAGEIGAGHTVTALYEIETTGAVDGPALTVQMRYADPTSGAVTELKQPFEAANMASDFTSATPRFQLAVAVAAFAEQLRLGPTQPGSLAEVLAIAQRIAPQLTRDPDVQEFLQLVTRTAQLKGLNP